MGENVFDALNFVCATLTKYDADRGGLATAMPDVERVVSAVELLSKRDDLEVAPFIDNWDPYVGRIDRPRHDAFFDRRFEQEINRTVASSFSGRYEDLIIKLIRAETSEGAGRVYQTLLVRLFNEIGSVLSIDAPSRFDYLLPLLTAVDPISIATLNYDRSVESVCEQQAIMCDVGVGGWNQHGELNWAPEGVNLMKLHGSIDWSFSDLGSYPQVDNRVFHGPGQHPANNVAATPAIIFGQREKLRPTGPFLQILVEFIHRLESASVLMVVGYSFRDPHVNEVIRRWMHRDSARQIIAIDPSPIEVAVDLDRMSFRHFLKNTYMPRQSQSGMSSRFHHVEEVASTGIVKAFELLSRL